MWIAAKLSRGMLLAMLQPCGADAPQNKELQRKCIKLRHLERRFPRWASERFACPKKRVVPEALAVGFRHFDTAQI
jgi:hypothetical protein